MRSDASTVDALARSRSAAGAVPRPAVARRRWRPALSRAGVAQAPRRRVAAAGGRRRARAACSCHTQTDRKTHARAPRRCVLGCTDCHGGDHGVKAQGAPGSEQYGGARRKAHVQPTEPRRSGATSANPERSYTALLDEDLAFVRFVNPGDLRAAPSACGPCHADEVRERLEEPDDPRRDALRRRALQQRRPARCKDAIVGESYGPDGKPRIADQTRPAAHGRGDPRQGRAAVARARSRAGSWASPATRSACSSAAAGGGWRSACPTCSRSPASRTRASRRAARARSTAPIPSSSARRRRGSLDPLLSHPGHERPPRRLPLQRLQRPATSSTRTTARASNSGPYAAFGNRGLDADRGPDDPEGRARAPAEARVHALDPVQPVHDLPHAPGHEHGRDLPRLHVVGQRGRRRAHVPEGAEEARRRRSSDAIERAQPRGRRAASGLWSRPQVPGRRLRRSTRRLKNTQFADFHGHGWVFRAVFKRDRKGNLLDAADKTGRRRRRPTSSGRPST